MISPEPIKAGEIGVGEVGYLIAGLRRRGVTTEALRPFADLLFFTLSFAALAFPFVPLHLVSDFPGTFGQ